MRKTHKIKITQAVIAAGGRGERLRPLTNNCPKPMVLVNGRPFLEYLIELLKQEGIKEVVLLLGYRAEKVMEHFKDGSKFGVKIKYSIGSVEDNNGTRLKNASSLLKDHFLFLFSDLYWPLDLEKLSRFYKRQGVLAMMTIYNNKDGRSEYGKKHNIQITNSGFITYYGPFEKRPMFRGIDIGTYILNKKVLPLMPDYDFLFQKNLISERLLPQGELAGYGMDYPYCTITNIKLLKKAAKYLSSKKIIFLKSELIDKKYFKPLRLLSDSGYKIFILSRDKVSAVTKKQLVKVGVKVNGYYFCSHHPKDGCECRLPKGGLMFRAAGDHNFNLRKAVLIGAGEQDLLIGEEVGCRVFIPSAKESLKRMVLELIKT